MKRVQNIPVLILISALLLLGCAAPTAALTAAPKLINYVQSQINTPVAAAPAAVAPVRDASAAVQTTSVAPVVASNSALSAFEGTLEQIYQQVNPSVVSIDVIIGGQSSGSRGNPFGSQGGGEALGSGFVWDTQGHIVTNNHVVSGANQVTVTFADGNSAPAKVVGTDPNADLAVIQVSGTASELHPVTLADSSQVKVGQVAIAIGNPFGLSNTMTEGIISALSRSIPASDTNSQSPFGSGASTGGSYTIPDIIQTDAAINPGNSGGVLLNDQGQVIGVTAAIQSATNSNAGIGFVIPSNIVKKVVPSLISTGSYAHPYMGISGADVDATVIQQANLPTGTRGVFVADVVAGGPSSKAGIQANDVITAVDGHALTRFDELTSYLFNNTQVGQTVSLTILRQGAEKTVRLTLGAIPNSLSQ